MLKASIQNYFKDFYNAAAYMQQIQSFHFGVFRQQRQLFHLLMYEVATSVHQRRNLLIYSNLLFQNNQHLHGFHHKQQTASFCKQVISFMFLQCCITVLYNQLVFGEPLPDQQPACIKPACVFTAFSSILIYILTSPLIGYIFATIFTDKVHKIATSGQFPLSSTVQ